MTQISTNTPHARSSTSILTDLDSVFVSRAAIILAIVTVLFLAATAAGIAALGSGPASARVPASDIRVIDAAFKDTRRPNMSDPIITLDRQAGAFGNAARQYHLIRDVGELDLRDSWIWVPSLGGPAKAYLNNVPIGSSTPHAFAGVGQGSYSLLAEAPEALFLSGLNRIDIRMETDPFRTGAGPIFIGPADRLLPRAVRARSLRSALYALSVLGAVSSLIALVVMLMTHGEAWRGGALLCAGGGALMMLSPMTAYLGMDTVAASRFLSPLLLLMGFALASVGTNPSQAPRLPSRLEYAIVSIASLGALASAVSLLQLASPVWSWTFLPLSFWTSSTALLSLIVLSALAILAATRRYRRSFTDAQQRILHQDALISAQEDRLQDTIRRTAIMEERQRFTRDMHDGIGGQLTSLLIRLRSGRADMDTVEHDLQSGLADLRNIVDSLDHVGDDLDAAFITFRARAEQQVRAAGMDFQWNQPVSIEGISFNTREVLHTYRFMQEALTNAMRHSDGSCITITVKRRDNSIDISVADDGVGYDVNGIRAGRGVRSLHERAAKLDGQMRIDSSVGKGTSVHLSITRDAARSEVEPPIL